jgi:hypothetical protein
MATSKIDKDGLRTKLQTLHSAILERPLDTKTLNYHLYNITNGSSSLEEFEKSLLTGEDYKSIIVKKYKDYYIDLIGFDMSEDDINAFVQAHIGRLISADDVRQYIVKLPQFDEKYVGVIKSFYQLTRNEPCNIDVINFYLRLFKLDKDYSIDRMTSDIHSGLHLTHVDTVSGEVITSSGKAAEYVDIARSMESVLGRLPTEQDVAQFVQYLRSGPTVVTQTPTLSRDILCAFETEFKRPMYVEEYFKYVIEKDAAPTPTPALWASLRSKHSEQYNHLREIYHDYTGEVMSEYQFVKQYLYDVDRADFFDSIIDEIVNSELYKQSMKKVLCNKYKSMYDETLEDHDFEFVFKRVHVNKMSIVDDELDSTLSNLKRETDEIVSHIFKQYMRVLERQPDMYEIDTYIRLYRDNILNSLDDRDALLEQLLMKSLEFHDIIKKRVRTLYKTERGSDILPSIMFSILNKTLEAIQQSVITMDSIDTIIKTFF